MAPTIQAQHVVAVTIPTIAVLFFTYLWYKKRSNSISRSRNDPGGGGTSRKRTRHRNTTATALPSASVSTSSVEQEIFPEAMKNAMQKAIRDLETASPIQEICSDLEENQLQEAETSSRSPRTSETQLSTSQSNRSFTSEHLRFEENNNESGKSSVMSQDEIDNNDIVEDDLESDTVSEEEIMTSTTKSDLQTELHTPVDSVDDANGNSTKISQIVGTNDHKCVDAEKSKSEGSACCTTVSRQQFECKNNAKNQESSSTSNDVDDNLDVAMQKLESMRLSDKPKRKQTNAKRKNHLTNDNNLISNSDSNNTTKRSNSPPSTLSQLASPPSKARKRKSKKRSKANQNGNNSDDSSTCKLQNGEVSPEVTASTCDSNKNIETCTSRTNNKDSKHGKMFLNSQESDRLSCNLKESDECDLKVIENHQKDCDNERDSANHSPVDTILDCQSVQFSDAHSEGSSDSGKGCSEGAVSPSPQTPAGGSSISGDQNVILVFQFVIPQEHVGKLIGKHGQFINTIKASSNTRIYIKKHPTSYKKKICALEGTQSDINKALELIRIRFPEETYPDVTLEEFPMSQPIACPLRPELYQLDLVEGVNNDVVISSIVTAGHLFLQQPMHPTYQSLTLLNISMNQVYNSPEAPLVLKPVKDNIVAAPAMGGWYRAQITVVEEGTESCDVRFLDYGGYLTLNTTCLRAVRADFLSLPFQAVECFLANIAPINDTWCEESKLVVQGLTYGQILQAQVYDYTPEGIPLILLYAVHGTQVILINDELVARGFAYPIVPNEGAQSEEYYVYS